jgi:anti-sigma B factor antagonist
MEIDQTCKDNTPVVSVSGRIDATTSKDLEAILSGLIDQNKSEIVIDLQGVTYISSIGLRVLLAAQKKVRAKNGSLILVSLQPFVREVFEMTGFTRLFPIYSHQSEALGDMRSK